MDIEERARQLLELYERDLRPLLSEHRVASLDALDQTKEVLANALATSDRLSVGFVGGSQVGKSSIINALLGDRVVPAGGLGPLTAQATQLGYRDVSALEVRYHRGDQLNRLALGIASYLKKRGELEEAPEITAEAEDVETMLDLEMAEDASAPEDMERKKPSKVGEHMLSQVQLMLRPVGEDRAVTKAIRALPRPTLLDAVRLMLDQEPLGDVSALESFRGRIEEVKRTLGRTENIEEAESDPTQFRRQLQLRAAGWMSPLVARLHVHIRHPLLRDVEIVDSPGVGNVADPGATVAASLVSKRSTGALVVVFRNNGLTEEVIDILDRGGVFTRLLWGATEGRPAIRIVVVVTYVDQVARERYNERVADPFADPIDPNELFTELAGEMEEKIRDDIRRALEDSQAYAEASSLLKDSEALVRRRLAEALDVMVVDAVDYMQILSRQTHGLFVSDEGATNVPKLRQLIRRVGEESTEARSSAIESAHAELHASLSEALGVLGNMYEGGGGRASSEWARFRDALARAASPLCAEMSNGREVAGRQLRDDLPEVLDEICAEAEANALKKLRALRRRGEKLYWPSLNAALQRDGTWDKQRLDYPGSLTRALVDSIAAAWEPQVVESVRGVVRELANAEISLVERVCDAAREIDEELTVEAQVDAQKKILRQQARSCIRWTNSRLEELRDDIEASLHTIVKEPIAQACHRARDRRRNRGKGATKKILDAFEEGSAIAIGVASKDAKRLLRKHYKKLLGQLEAGYLKEHHDPVTAAVEALTGEERDRAKQADDEARKAVLRKTRALARDLADVGPVREEEAA